MEEKKGKRGGARPGAGHPKGDSRMISFRAPGPLAEKLDGMENRTEFIRNTLDTAIRSQDKAPESIGKSIPASRVKSRALRYCNINGVAGLHVTLANDARSQDIDIISM